MSGADLGEARDLVRQLDEALERLDIGGWVPRADYAAETTRLRREVRARDETIRELRAEYIRMRRQALLGPRPVFLRIGDVQYVLAVVGPELAEEIVARLPSTVEDAQS